jgi:hypothetical protein
VKALRSSAGAEFFVIALPQLADIAASRMASGRTKTQAVERVAT